MQEFSDRYIFLKHLGAGQVFTLHKSNCLLQNGLMVTIIISHSQPAYTLCSVVFYSFCSSSFNSFPQQIQQGGENRALHNLPTHGRQQSKDAVQRMWKCLLPGAMKTCLQTLSRQRLNALYHLDLKQTVKLFHRGKQSTICLLQLTVYYCTRKV